MGNIFNGLKFVNDEIGLCKKYLYDDVKFFKHKKCIDCKLAKENGLEMVDQKYFFTQFRYDALQRAKEKQKLMLDSEKTKKTSLNLYERPYLGTVGAIALDKNGNLAAATSTGGMTNKMTGRIGDSPIIGSGTYADNDSVAVSCTGTGDIYMRVNDAHEVSALYKYKTSDV